MPIRIPDALPATDILERENIFVMTEYRAFHQDIRPLRVILLNLMPTKIATETQIIRKLSNTPLQVELTLLHMASHESKNTSDQHLEAFYRTFGEISHEHFDGMIITGAPVEQLDFESVDYWPELCDIMAWTRTHVHSTLHICWGAQAGIYYHYGIQKYPLSKKLSGVFPHRQVKVTSPLLRGFDDTFNAPHSRYTEVHADEIEAHPMLELLAVSDEAGVYIAKSIDSRDFFIFGHPEYDRATLGAEYDRDVKRGLDIAVPAHYYPDDNPENAPESNWRAHAQLLYTNWLNYYVYQTTPYDVREAGTPETHATPLSEATKTANPPSDVAKSASACTQEKPTVDACYLRAENEDDDGYDPYSDRREEPPLFEPDPWR